MAQGHGLHKDLQADVGGDELVRRYRRLWWTVYTLDRRFSSSFGVPTSLQDEDITTPLPKPSDDDDEESGTARMLYVQICQLYGRVISSTLPPSTHSKSLTPYPAVYSSQNELNKTFVLKTRTILKGVAGLSAKLKAFSQSCFGEISRVAAHVNLAYHQVSAMVPLRKTIVKSFSVYPCIFEAGPILRIQTTPRGCKYL
jgi:hypothetical protein